MKHFFSLIVLWYLILFLSVYGIIKNLMVFFMIKKFIVYLIFKYYIKTFKTYLKNVITNNILENSCYTDWDSLTATLNFLFFNRNCQCTYENPNISGSWNKWLQRSERE